MKKYKVDSTIRWEFEVWLEAETPEEAQNEIAQILGDDVAHGVLPIDDIQDVATIDNYPPPMFIPTSVTDA